MRRSVSTDLELDPGTYSVLMKITAKRYKGEPIVEDVIRSNVRLRQDKLIQVGLSYDLAHAKGIIRETEAEKQERKAREDKKKAEEKQKQRKLKRKQLLADWEAGKRRKAREKRQAMKKEAFERKKAAKVKAVESEEPTANGDAPKPATSGASTAAAGIEGEVEKQAAAGATETKTGEPAADPASLPSPPAEAKAEQEQEAKDSTPTTTDAPPKEDTPPKEPSTNTTDPTPSQKSQHFEKALQSVPSVTVNGVPAPQSSAAAAPSLAPNDDDDYRYDSDASFDSSIDSVLDFPQDPITSLSDDEDSDLGSTEKKNDEPTPDDDEDANKEFENDPWNAVCVVGLRVYSKDEGCAVEAVRPREEEEPLDLDDASKGASGELDGKSVEVKINIGGGGGKKKAKKISL